MERIESLQSLRAIACLAVFFVHAGFFSLGAWGVSVFLVLSGFLMVYNYAGRDLDNGIGFCLSFSLDKVRHLYPAHIIAMLMSIPMTYMAIQNTHKIGTITIHILAHTALVHDMIPYDHIYGSLNGVSWYLSLSLFLYMIFPFIIKNVKTKSIMDAIKSICITYALQIIFESFFVSVFRSYDTLFSEDFIVWFVYCSPIMRVFDFYIGCNLGVIYLEKKDSIISLIGGRNVVGFSLMESFVIVTIGVLSKLQRGGYGGTYFFSYFSKGALFIPSTICCVILFAVHKGIWTQLLNNRGLIWLGDISPYVFIFHRVILLAVLKMIDDKWSYRNYVAAVLGFIITVVFSLAYMISSREITNRIKTG